MISTKLDFAILEAIYEHATFNRLGAIDVEQTQSALRRVTFALLVNITDPDERAAMLNALVEELQRAAQWQTSERDQGQLRAEGVHHSRSMVDTAEGGRAVAGRLALMGEEGERTQTATEVFKNWPRLDGAAAWAILTPAQQAEVGAIVLEFAVAQHGMDRYAESSSYEARPFNVAEPLLFDALEETVALALSGIFPDLFNDDLPVLPPVPIPSFLGQICRVCGCSEAAACDGGCAWGEPDLCTACVPSGAV